MMKLTSFFFLFLTIETMATETRKAAVIELPEDSLCNSFASNEDCDEAKTLIYKEMKNEARLKTDIIQNSYDLCEMDEDNEVCEKERGE